MPSLTSDLQRSQIQFEISFMNLARTLRVIRILLFSAALVVMLASCKEQPQKQPASDGAAVAEEAPAAVVAAAAEQEGEPKPPVDGAFVTPLPEGVVLVQPHHVRMDRLITSDSGKSNRRSEFEYLEGNAEQAMQQFAEAMVAAGFESQDGPSVEEGVVRQAFKKAGYGTVFARAQEQASARNMHESAHGFVVVSWPAPMAK